MTSKILSHDQIGDPIICENNVCRFTSKITTRGEGHRDICIGERRGVVDAVPNEHHFFPLGREVLNEFRLLIRKGV